MDNPTPYMTYLTLLIPPFLISFISIGLGMKWAIKMGLFMDTPEDRKIHKEPIPRIGGIGIIGATLITLAFWTPLSKELVAILVGCSTLFIVGIADDLYDIRPRTKFIGQLIACMLTVAIGDIYLKGFGDILGIGSISFPPNIGIPLTIFAIIGMINAINFIDGMDGLAGGTSCISLVGFGHLASINGNDLVVGISLVLCAAIIAFLIYNWHPAKVFMGDSGSLCLGYLLGFLAILLTQEDKSTIPPVAALLILGLPVGDTIWVMTRRIIHRTSPFKADQGHLHHKLLSLGLNQNSTVISLYIWTFFLCLLAISTHHIPAWAIFWGYIGGSISVYGGISFLRLKKSGSRTG